MAREPRPIGACPGPAHRERAHREGKGVAMKTAMIISSLSLMLACGSHTTETAPVLSPASVHVVSAQSGPGEGWVAATLSSTQRAVLSTRMAAAVRKIYVT